MTKYIIVKIDSETKMKSFLKVEMEPVLSYSWTNDIDQATKYENHEYEQALIDWHYAVHWCNPFGDRIIMPIYDENQPPWE